MDSKKYILTAISILIIILGVSLSTYYDYFILICFFGLLILAIAFSPTNNSKK